MILCSIQIYTKRVIYWTKDIPSRKPYHSIYYFEIYDVFIWIQALFTLHLSEMNINAFLNQIFLYIQWHMRTHVYLFNFCTWVFLYLTIKICTRLWLWYTHYIIHNTYILYVNICVYYIIIVPSRSPDRKTRARIRRRRTPFSPQSDGERVGRRVREKSPPAIVFRMTNARVVSYNIFHWTTPSGQVFRVPPTYILFS